MMTRCQECYKNSALFAQFLLSFLTYVLLSYFVHLHCTNIHTPLPFLSYFYDFQNIKTRHSDLFYNEEHLCDYFTAPGYPHTLGLALHPLPTDEESLLCQGTQLCPDCENYAVVTLFFLNFPYLLQDLLS